jgi:predicted lysophospholipase L1 biosynthesis ABC-type transport system permease subunit
VDEQPIAMAYFPYTQGSGAPPTLQVELRTKGDPLSALSSVQRVIQEMDPNIPLEKPMSQAAVFEDSYAQQRLFSRLAMFFGLLAALLVGIGLYGTLSYRISRRSTEIGVRMALGARRGQVLGMVMRESLLIAGLGVALGIPLAMLTGHFMGSMLFDFESYDRWTALASLVGVVGIGLAAGYLQARCSPQISRSLPSCFVHVDGKIAKWSGRALGSLLARAALLARSYIAESAVPFVASTVVQLLACWADVTVAFRLVGKALGTIEETPRSPRGIPGRHIRRNLTVHQPLQKLAIA